jgi:hypothetical protein
MYDPPFYVWVLIIAGPAAIAAATSAALYKGAVRSGSNQRNAGLLTGLSAVVFAGWLAATGVIAAAGWYRILPWFPVAIAGYLAVLLALTRLPMVRRALAAPGMTARLMLPHSFRVVGVFFLFYLAFGHLPALFALPAGLGDIAAGIAAPVVVRRLSKSSGPRAAVWFNVFGIVDLMVGMTLGALTAFPVLHVSPTSAVITELPLALIPTFTVPLMMTLHLTSLSRLVKPWRPRLSVAARPSGITPSAGVGKRS